MIVSIGHHGIISTMRYGPLALATWYFLVSTNLVYAGLDVLLPLTKTVTSLDFPCALHNCGCKTAKQCRLHCCCHAKKQAAKVPETPKCHLKKADTADNKPTTVPVSRLSQARCHGQEPQGALSTQKLDPHIPLATVSMVASPAFQSSVFQHDGFPQTAFLDPPDKVPIPSVVS